MSNNNQTSVDQLFDQLCSENLLGLFTHDQMKRAVEILNEAKAMHNEEIKNAELRGKEIIIKHTENQIPIELPSDEEINKEALNYITYSGFTGFTTCAVWLRHKIQGGNK